MKDNIALNSCVVAVFAKSPLPGKVKTRLGKDIGSRNAVRIYKKMLYTVLSNITKHKECTVELWCSPDTKHPFIRACARDFGVILKKQNGKDLGERMYNAFKQSLRKYDYCVLIGSDIPDINHEDIRQSGMLIHDNVDVVVLPTDDGGYGLIATGKRIPTLFSGLTWSTESVLEKTCQKIRKKNYQYQLLDSKMDIDTKKDLRRYRFYSAKNMSCL